MHEKSRDIAIAGLGAALSEIFLLCTSYMRMNTLAFLCLCALLTAIVLTESGVACAAIGYVATSLLALLTVADKQTVLCYIVFFGWYPILKFFAETRQNKISEWILKAFGFHLAAAVLCALLYVFFQIDIFRLPLPFWLLWPIGIGAFILIDIVLSLGIHFYLVKRRKTR